MSKTHGVVALLQGAGIKVFHLSVTTVFCKICITIFKAKLILLFLLLLFWDGSCSVTQAGVQWCDQTHYSLNLLGSSNPPISASQLVRTTRVHHHAGLIFLFFIGTGFPRLVSNYRAQAIRPPLSPKVLGLQAKLQNLFLNKSCFWYQDIRPLPGPVKSSVCLANNINLFS